MLTIGAAVAVSMAAVFGSPPRRGAVALMMGQSNMVGFGMVSHDMNAVSGVRISNQFGAGSTALQPLRVGFGVDENFFGSELGFGESFRLLRPSQDLVIIKSAIGGVPITYFMPSGAIYNTTLHHTNAMLTSLQETGVNYRVAGLLWMQGESDAFDANLSKAYETNFRTLVDSLRRDLHVPNLPVVAGLISQRYTFLPYADTVRTALTRVANGTVETSNYSFMWDGVHFDGPSLLQLGRHFAEHLVSFGNV